jgi:hypothetical protein
MNKFDQLILIIRLLSSSLNIRNITPSKDSNKEVIIKYKYALLEPEINVMILLRTVIS